MQKAQGFRHELKYGIDPFSYLVLRQRLSTVMRRDSHAGTDATRLSACILTTAAIRRCGKNRMGSTAGKSSGCAAIMMIARHFFWKKSRRSMGYA